MRILLMCMSILLVVVSTTTAMFTTPDFEHTLGERDSVEAELGFNAIGQNRFMLRISCWSYLPKY